jgi:hypothetical protein
VTDRCRRRAAQPAAELRNRRPPAPLAFRARDRRDVAKRLVQPRVVEPGVGSVSCRANAFCVVVGSSGDIDSAGERRRLRIHFGNPAIGRGLMCPDGVCVVLGNDGKWNGLWIHLSKRILVGATPIPRRGLFLRRAVWDSHGLPRRWRKRQREEGCRDTALSRGAWSGSTGTGDYLLALDSVSCAGLAFCIAVGDGYAGTYFSGSSLKPERSRNLEVRHVCLAVLCVGVGGNGPGNNGDAADLPMNAFFW